MAATCQTSNREQTEKMLEGVVDRIDFTRIHNWAGGLGMLTGQRIRKPCDRLMADVYDFGERRRGDVLHGLYGQRDFREHRQRPDPRDLE